VRDIQTSPLRSELGKAKKKKKKKAKKKKSTQTSTLSRMGWDSSKEHHRRTGKGPRPTTIAVPNGPRTNDSHSSSSYSLSDCCCSTPPTHHPTTPPLSVGGGSYTTAEQSTDTHLAAVDVKDIESESITVLPCRALHPAIAVK